MTRLEFDDLVRKIERRFAHRQRDLERATSAWITLGLLAK